MIECVVRAIAALLTTIGLAAIISGNVGIGYPLFGVGIYWLSYKEGE